MPERDAQFTVRLHEKQLPAPDGGDLFAEAAALRPDF
jgi:hypothetical protein